MIFDLRLGKPETQVSYDCLLVAFIECSVEGHIAWREVDTADEISRFGGSMETIHPDVFPFDRERSIVVNVIQRHNDVLEFDIAMSR